MENLLPILNIADNPDVLVCLFSRLGSNDSLVSNPPAEIPGAAREQSSSRGPRDVAAGTHPSGPQCGPAAFSVQVTLSLTAHHQSSRVFIGGRDQG